MTDDAEFIADALRGKTTSDAAYRTVAVARAQHEAGLLPDNLTVLLADGDRRTPDDPRRFETVDLGSPQVDADPDTTALLDLDRVRSNGHQPYRSTRLADVEPETVDWIWPGKLPRGKLVTFFGDPDIGKSTLCLDWAARVTTGQPMPAETRAHLPASSVVIMSAEDGLADTVRPRLDAAHADTTRVHHLDAVARYDDENGTVTWVPPSLPDDLSALEALIIDTGAALVVIDVLTAYLSERHKVTSDQDVRRALAPLADIAERTGACVVLIGHIPKSQRRSGDRIAATGGAMGVVGAARVGMLAAVDPEDETEQRRVLARAKGNLAPPWPSLAYTLVPSGDHARVEWLGEVEITADQLLAERQSDDEKSKTDEAAEWLAGVLAKGGRRRSELVIEGRPEGFPATTIDRAGRRLGVVSERDDEIQGRPATWRLPTPPGFKPPGLHQTEAVQTLQASDQGKQPEIFGLHQHTQSGANKHSELICVRCGGPPDHPPTTHQPQPAPNDEF